MYSEFCSKEHLQHNNFHMCLYVRLNRIFWILKSAYDDWNMFFDILSFGLCKFDEFIKNTRMYYLLRRYNFIFMHIFFRLTIFDRVFSVLSKKKSLINDFCLEKSFQTISKCNLFWMENAFSVKMERFSELILYCESNLTMNNMERVPILNSPE